MRRIIRRRGISFLRLFLIALVLVVIISYISLCKLVIVNDDKISFEGKKLSVASKLLREQIIKKYNAKRFTCNSKENISLAGLFIERENPVGTALLCHGFRCCKELMYGYIDLLPNYNIVMFDFRSHGENKKALTTIGCHEYKDVVTVVHWIKKKQAPTCVDPLGYCRPFDGRRRRPSSRRARPKFMRRTCRRFCVLEPTIASCRHI